ncbi:MAG: PKD domain-containing protein [Patescibacteria group bacterium]|nr:PKD domain-containing protein [Patescibacteria group bacterium]
MKLFIKSKIFLLIVFVVFGFFVFGKVEAGTEHNVSGWAWSENIGWISFNSINCDVNGNGIYEGVSEGAPAGCPTSGPVNSYGVNIDTATGTFSGYAWSENVGWISFNESELTLCPTGTCRAEINLSTNEVSGWARALNYGDGWDGWIHLRDTSYGILRNPSANELEDWAWSDVVVGWISFNCNNPETGDVCLTSDYKVITFGTDTVPPTVSVQGAPIDWQNTDATADISCSDPETGCDTGSYMLKTYDSDPVNCPTNYGDYDLTEPQIISSHKWICGAAKDLAGNAGFSDPPEEFKVDKIPPSTSITDPAASSWHKDDFIATIDDSDIGGSGLAVNCEYLIVGLNPDTGSPDCSPGILPRSCDPVDINVPVGSGICSGSNICIFEGQNRCKVTSYAYDNAGNVKQASENFSIDFSLPVVGEILPQTADEGIEETFSASLVDPAGKVIGCQLYIDGVLEKPADSISPIPCENGANCTVSATHTFTSSGTYSMHFECQDEAGNNGSGNPVSVVVAPNNPPTITDGPSFTTTPSTGGTAGIDYCATPTTQSGCNIYFNVSSTDPNGDTLSYSWDFGDGGSSNQQNPVYYYSAANTYTVIVTISDGRGGSAVGSVNITVTDPTLLVDLCVGLDISVACYPGSVSFQSPANNIDLKADVSGTMYGTMNYKFDCTNDGTWDFEISNQTSETYAALNLCDYLAGVYTAETLVQRGTGSNQDTVIITVIVNEIPVLDWTGEPGYTSDGVEPESGDSNTNFVYRVEYSDAEGEAPNFVRVRIKKDNKKITGSPFTMSYVSGTFIGGAIYSYTKSALLYGLDYTYFFEAEDGSGINATPTVEIDAPDVNNSPQAAVSCDATNCGPGSSCNGSWIAYNRNCAFSVIDGATDPDDDIVKSVWSIFYQDNTPWQDPYLTCIDDPGTSSINEAICDLLLPSLPASQNYYVKLYVEDIVGASDQTQRDFYVKKEAIAAFDCSLSPGGGWQICSGFRVSEGEIVYFRDLSSASEGAEPISSRSWYFEDGNPASNIDNETAPSSSFTVVDLSSGLISLDIVDTIGRIDSQQHQVQITVPLPEWREVPPL